MTQIMIGSRRRYAGFEYTARERRWVSSMVKSLLIAYPVLLFGALAQSGIAHASQVGHTQAIVVAQSDAADSEAQPKTDGAKTAAEEEPEC